MNYIYKILSTDAVTGMAQVQYAPAKDSLPTLVRSVDLSKATNEHACAVAIVGKAPSPEWFAIDPSINPTPVILPFEFDFPRQPPTEQP